MDVEPIARLVRTTSIFNAIATAHTRDSSLWVKTSVGNDEIVMFFSLKEAQELRDSLTYAITDKIDHDAKK